MKTKIFIFILFCLLISECKAQWVYIGPSTGLYVSSFTVNNSNIFAGMTSGIYISSNNGLNWTQVSFNYGSIWSLASNGNNIFAGTRNSGLFMSSNNGQSWTNVIYNANWIGSLAANSTTIFAGTGIGTASDGVHRSTDNGLNWTQSLQSTAVFSLAASDSNIYAIARWGDFYRSSNNGQNWSHLSTLTNTYESYSFLLYNGNLFTGTENFNPQGGVQISTNNGLNWSQTSLSNVNVYSLAASGSNIYAGSDSGVYVSSNNGSNWVQHNEGMGSLFVRSILINGNYIYAGTNGNSIWRRPLSELVGIQHTGNSVPSLFSLSQNYPNPFNPATKIKFNIPSVRATRRVALTIFDILGKEVVTLINEQLKPGTYEADFDGTNLPSGVYFYKLENGGYSESMKMVLIK